MAASPRLPNIHPRRWLVLYPRAVPLAVFALVMAVTISSVIAVERIEQQNHRSRQAEIARSVAFSLDRRAEALSVYLRAGAALFADRERVGRDEFAQFLEDLQPRSEYLGIDGIGWAARVENGDFGTFERAVTQETGRPFRIAAIDASSPFAVPVTFLLPDNARNRRAIGFNMYSDAVRRAAMDEAVRTGLPAASGPVVLKQEGTNGEPGFLMYAPLFEGRGNQRRLRGFLYSPFNARHFLQPALSELGSAGQQVGLRLIDPAAAQAEVLRIGDTAGNGRSATQHRLTIGNRAWVMEVVSPRDRALSPLSLAILLFGLLVALLLTLLARILTRQASEDEAAIAWFAEQNSIRNSLTRELNHRVKNTLANVLSIITLTRRRASSLDEFAEGLIGRVRALSATHDLLTQSEWGSTPVHAVIEAELAPYMVDQDERCLAFDGPDIELAPNDALSLGLAIHELATNAAKYGALSVAEGKVAVSWRAMPGGFVAIDWIEEGGPSVAQERKRGFGLDLIEKIVAHELGSPVDLRFEPGGVRCTLMVPVRRPRAFSPRPRA